jgi:hypothetical protein
VSAHPEIRIRDGTLEVWSGAKLLLEASLDAVLSEVARSVDVPDSVAILPNGARIWRSRREARGIAVEVPAHARTVRWIKEDSREPFGPRASFHECYLAFPYIVLLLVFRGGKPTGEGAALTGRQELFFRTAPLGGDSQELYLPNLLNVARGYGQRSWVCLQGMSRKVVGLSWSAKVDAIIDHVFSAAFNRSAEMHEGNSYWGSSGSIDPRLATIEAWEEASRANPLFPLEVRWKPANTTATQELDALLDQVVAPARLGTATELSGLVTRLVGRKKPR